MSFKVKRRKKASRFRGSHTHGRGFKKKARGSGHQGGVGMAGTGKRGDQKKTLILNMYGKDYFGKKPVRGRTPAVKYDAINIRDIVENVDSMIKHGSAKESGGTYIINLKGHKVLSEGEATIKMHITASAASAGALDKVKKAGGEITISKTSGEVSPKPKAEEKAAPVKKPAVKVAKK